jgi:outer membrane protein assembly factor BamE (lipoprotein component of BamABCDE complex)
MKLSITRRRNTLTLLAGLAAFMGGCDLIAQKELKVGESTVDDVKTLMGKPDMIWEEKDGSQVLEFSRAPAGHETYHVRISPDGKYLGMKNILTRENFARVVAGMTQDQVRQVLGRATETVEFKLKQQTVWSYRHMADPGRKQMFNVHFDTEGKVVSTSTTDDPPNGQG